MCKFEPKILMITTHCVYLHHEVVRMCLKRLSFLHLPLTIKSASSFLATWGFCLLQLLHSVLHQLLNSCHPIGFTLRRRHFLPSDSCGQSVYLLKCVYPQWSIPDPHCQNPTSPRLSPASWPTHPPLPSHTRATWGPAVWLSGQTYTSLRVWPRLSPAAHLVFPAQGLVFPLL